ncbi:uncharacterized protein LOC105935956 [Fundulus heteroclitus]|uniref:uncharacterized protein LOC105935956 n=1 Tax=Fundulus heteroclitus TaxID=8078 RepID=UPI00165B4BA5|nr:uncharacterized protein LOC105935956 [Fundulus heteroclitus]
MDPVADDGISTVYIQNISPAEVRDLRETLTKIDCVKNFFPLLNKVFIEFESARDADRIGVWYSLLKRCPAHNIYRMKLPRHTSTSLPPRLAPKALPDSKDVAAGPVVPATSVGVPLGSTPPFSVTITTTPFIFPTASPWFIIPNFSTIKTKRDLWTPASKGPKSSTIMLTRLPEGNYKHEDIAKLVWSYFRKQNLQTLLYNIVVLPLQRRAFVHFADWLSCCNFVGDFLKSPASINDCTLYLHQVLQEMPSGFSEDIMYRNMMKWSNAHVPELESLEERLLIVVVSEISVYLIINIMKAVTSIAPIVSFLPLASRICIEMVDSSGVTRVVENISHASNLEVWTKVQCVESAKSLKQHINDCTNLKINLEEDMKDIWTKTPAAKSKPQLPPADVADTNTQPGLQGSAEMSDIAVADKEVDSATKTNQASKENVSEAEVKIVEKTEKNEAEKKIEPSKSTVLEKQVCISELVQESAKTTQRGIEPVPEKKGEAQTVKDNIQPHVSKNAKTPELKDTRQTDQIEAKGSAEAKEEEVKPSSNPLLTHTVKTAPHKPLTDPAQEVQTTLKTHKPTPEVQKDKKPNPDPSSVKRDASQKPQPTAGAPAAVAVRSASKVKLPDAGNSCLTPGDQIENHLNATTEFNWVSVDASSSAFLSLDVILVISNLPAFRDGCYTEADVIALLQNLGVHCEKDKIFIIPQSLVAFVFSPNMKEVQELMLAKKDVVFKDSKLCFGVIEENKPSNLFFQFRVYKFLMSFATFKSCYPQRAVYIQDISVNEARSLKTEMRRVGSMINYLPLLNKVFVEFQSMCDCDRVGVWHGFLKHRRSHTVYRLGVPEASATSKPPRMPALALPSNSLIVAKAGVPKENAVPLGSKAPFWVTMTTKPFLFPTASPWFNIPAYWQHSSMENIRKCMLEGFMRPTIMLTGLPMEAYTHEDVAALVWKYLPAHSLHTLLYNVMVLPLQRRAFVCFSGWEACSSFFQDHLTKPIVFKGSTCYAYLVRENIHPADDEESLYKTLMKWSNTHVAEPVGLEERLLCVGVSAMDQHTAMAVMEEVASIDTFTNFLPLADRIYIEMTTSSGVKKVVENTLLSKLGKKREDWKKVGRIESVKSRKKRLTDCKTIPVKLEPATVHTEPTAVKSEEHRGSPCRKETRSSDSAEPSAAAAGLSNAATREKRDAEKTTRSTVTDVKTADETGDESPTGCALRPRTLVQPGEENLQLPKMDLESFNVVKALLTQFRLQRENAKVSQEVSSKCSSSSSAGPKDERNRETESPGKRSERQSSSSDALPADRRTSAPSSKNLMSLSPSKSPKMRFSPHATSSSKPSSSARGQGTSTSSSSDPVRTKGASSSAGRTHLSSGGLSRSSETCQPQKNILGPGERAGDKSAEGKPKADEQNAELPGRNERPEKDCTDKTRSKTEENHKDKVGQSKEENHLNLNSLGGKAGEDTEKEQKQDIRFKGGQVGPEMSRSLDQGELEAKTRSEAETNAAVQEKGEVSVSEENRQVKGLTVKPDKRTGASIPAEKENTAVRREGSDKESESETKDRGRAEERVSEGGVQDDSSTGSKPDETTRRKAATNEPPIATRSTRAGRKTTSDEANEDGTPTRRRTGTPPRDTQEQKKQEAVKTEEETSPTTCEQQASQESSDDVGLGETEEQEEGAAAKRPRGRPRRTALLTPVRKSARGRNSECPDGQTAKECKEERKDDVKVPSKRTMELCGPESKKPRVSADFKLPPFDPKTPLGKEFVRRKWGNFCNLCSVAFLDQSTEDQHCRTQMHYDNLQKYHQKRLNLKPLRILKQK